MSAVTEVRSMLNDLKGSTLTNEQTERIGLLFTAHWPNPTPTNEEKAVATQVGIRTAIRKLLRRQAEDEVYSAMLAAPHIPANQQAMYAATEPTATAAGDAAEDNL